MNVTASEPSPGWLSWALSASW